MKNRIFALLIVLHCAACSPFIDNRGFNHETLDLTKIVIGTDTKETLLEKFGSPSTTSLYPSTPGGHDSKWFYITKKTSRKAFFNPETLNQQTVEVCFDDKGIVRDVLKIEGETAVSLNSDKTASTGYESNAMRDIFGNFGRYSARSPVPQNN
jgi:outer membrane protein assembly factor BamE (lipoprotein component of BamABCDE complex)